MPSSILFVHQGYELYGSDRTLIQSVEAAVERWPDARITVLLPGDGPLRAALAEVVDDVRVERLGVLRRASLRKLRFADAWGFLVQVLAARRMMSGYDVVYINTVMVADYLVASSLSRTPRLVHVHEIPTGLMKAAFSSLLTMSRGFPVFNSEATRRSFVVPPWRRFAVVWNGTGAAGQSLLRDQRATLNVLLIGRLNAWKGQAVLVKAMAHLAGETRSRMAVRLVGSFFSSQSHFAEELQSLISDLGLSKTVEVWPFAPDPSEHYRWADVVVVPSTRPEPFGLVAIEAMAAGCAVIASDHGGLSEIVLDGTTGTLVAPGSVDALAAALERYVAHPELARTQGDSGRRRFAAEFDEARYKSKIVGIIAGRA